MKWTQRFPFKRRERCPFCLGQDFRPLLAYDDLKLWRCRCGYVFMNPFLSEEGSRLIFSSDPAQYFPWLEDFERNLGAADSGTRGIKTFNRSLAFLEAARGAKPGRILDVGCGSGHFLEIAKKRGWRAEGLDLSPECVSRTHARTGLLVHLGRLEELHAAPYDALTLWDYFEHVEDPVQILRTARALLNSGGMLVIACPHHGGLVFVAARILHALSFGKIGKPVRLVYPPTHLSYFTPGFIKRAAAREGFKCERILFDETDLSRLHLPEVFKRLARIIFTLARMAAMSNRFILFLRKGES